MTNAKLIFAALVLASAGLGATAASADTAPLANHGRRAKINARLSQENVQIRDAARAGLITPQQAHALHREVRSIRVQEQAFAAAQNGHLTHHQQHLLNREESAVASQIAR